MSRQGSRRQQFDLVEQPALQPLREEPFLINKYATLILRNNCHIQIREDKHYYSEPHSHDELPAHENIRGKHYFQQSFKL